METIQKTDKTQDAANRIACKNELRFMDVVNRNIAFDIIKKSGIAAKKSISHGQYIHPEYIEDYAGEIEIGFGNSMYQTFFSKLYNISIIR